LGGCSINPPSALPGKPHDANYDTFMNYLKTKNMCATHHSLLHGDPTHSAGAIPVVRW
jgi:hypothetical protein